MTDAEFLDALEVAAWSALMRPTEQWYSPRVKLTQDEMHRLEAMHKSRPVLAWEGLTDFTPEYVIQTIQEVRTSRLATVNKRLRS